MQTCWHCHGLRPLVVGIEHVGDVFLQFSHATCGVAADCHDVVANLGLMLDHEHNDAFVAIATAHALLHQTSPINSTFCMGPMRSMTRQKNEGRGLRARSMNMGPVCEEWFGVCHPTPISSESVTFHW
jgi:hypothetical protein